MGLPPTASLRSACFPQTCARAGRSLRDDVSTLRDASPRAARTWGKPVSRRPGAQRTNRAPLAGRAGDGWGRLGLLARAERS